MQRKAAVFCHSGIGDGIVSLVISNNFHQNGWEIDTYHNGMKHLQNWFPQLPILDYPEEAKVSKILSIYDEMIVFHNHSNEFVLRLIEEGKKICPEKIRIIYPYPSKNIIYEPYYKDSYIDPKIPIVQNLERFCTKILKFPNTTRNNGFIAPMELNYRQYSKRIILHTASSREGKNWPRNKYVKLALHLEKSGFDPIFVVGGKKEQGDWNEYLHRFGFALPTFYSLDEITRFIYESGYLIGNDSGFGHLASCLGLPTVTISRRKTVAKFWRPFWAPGKIVNPSAFIPNIRGLRLRDRKWKYFISVKKVLRAFETLFQECSHTHR